MSSFMKRVDYVLKNYRDKIGFIDSGREMTYGELDIESGRIYAWLKKQGISKDDFVQILIPRGVACLAAVIGVAKAGAAFVLMETDYPAKRIEYIRQDVGAKVVITGELYREIMESQQPLEGYEETSPHDAAFAVYTSGSTGNPKGILQEQGSLDLISSYIEPSMEYGEKPLALVSPLSFLATFVVMINIFNFLRPLYIAPTELLRDFTGLCKFFEEKRVYGVFLSPSYLRLYKNPSPHMELIIVAGEGASNLYFEGGRPVLRNLYSMSEAGYCILGMDLDKAYDQAPLGFPTIDEIDVHLQDENGNRVIGPGEGEICYKNEYIRCYINLPEKTAEALRGGYFHTGDLARRDENGMYFLMGRCDDMFKINGNRVEPGEIESAFRKVTGLNTVAAKMFDENGRSYICLYYLKGEAIEKGILDGAELTADLSPMADMLPRYMLPTYYIPMDAMPLNERGKLVRRLLPPPVMEHAEEKYVPPANDKERDICGFMAEILELERFGADSDFYQMGGDSMRAIRLIVLAGEHGYPLTANDLYTLRTPRKLAEKCASALTDTRALEEAERQSEGEMRALLPMQKMFIDILLAHPELKMGQIAYLYKMLPDVDPERLRAAVDKVFRHYPIFRTKLVRTDNGEIKQAYDESLLTPTDIIELTQEEFQRLQKEPLEKLDLFHGAAYRKCVYLSEGACCLFLYFHHALMDGTGIGVVRDSIFECYKNPDYEIPRDYYYYLLKEIEEAEQGEIAREARQYYDELYTKKLDLSKCSCVLEPDLAGEFKTTQVYSVANAFERDESKTNLFYLTAAALAVAKCNKTDRAMVSVTYNGRDSLLKNNSAGGFAFRAPIYLVIEDGDTPKDLLAKVKEQAEFGASHVPYSYFRGDGDFVDNAVIFLYQKNIFSPGKLGAYIEQQLPLCMDMVYILYPGATR